MKLGSDKRIRWWRFISSQLSALSFLEKRCKIVSEWDGNECCWSPSSSSSPSLFKSEQFCTQSWQHNHEQDWTMANYCAVENAVGGNRKPWKSHSRENPTERRRRKSSYGMHIYNYRNNNSLLLALLSHLIRSTVEYHLKHPHYATFDAREYLITCFHMAVWLEWRTLEIRHHHKAISGWWNCMPRLQSNQW